MRASTFIENFPQISAKPIALSSEICSGSSHEISRSLPIVFQGNQPRKFLRNSREFGRFFREFVPENPAKFDFFFCDLPEALIMGSGIKCFILFNSHFQRVKMAENLIFTSEFLRLRAFFQSGLPSGLFKTSKGTDYDFI